MSNKFELGDMVELRTFHGEMKAPLGTDRSENFWMLVGESGQIV